MPREELPIVSLLLERQRHHLPLDCFPIAANISNLPLYLGEAGAAQDIDFLRANKIEAVIAVGTGNLTVKPCEMLLIDILDMEDELLLPHFNECIEFLKQRVMRGVKPIAVLVHCVYGQSRSAAICIAFLMATQKKTLLEAYDEVQKARPCISINPGFLMQLELFGRMGNDPNIMGNTPAHAELRTMIARRQRLMTTLADISMTPHVTHPGNLICCRKCNYVLCTTNNQVRRGTYGFFYSAYHCLQLLHRPVNGGLCSGIYIEPMKWMTGISVFVSSNDGKLVCPSCKAKLGSWNWNGVKCSCKHFVSPAFQLVPSRIQSRANKQCSH
ncbi:putative Dual specificity phosphatase, catalytic domain, protein-tyrosine phosphatase [Plasmopara halstedii]